MSYFATEYTIHFDDTMAYGSHHFLTAFKFQCAARETFLFGELIYDVASVRQSLDEIRLLTMDAYARNLGQAKLGDRVAILLTLEEWGRVSARFCYRVIGDHGSPICAGFQTLICADAATGSPIELPEPLWKAMQQIREIEEAPAQVSFRDRVLAGGAQVDELFGSAERQAAVEFLSQRYPAPAIIETPVTVDEQSNGTSDSEDAEPDVEAWVFGGQGVFDADLLSERIHEFVKTEPTGRETLDRCASIAQELIGGDASAVVSGVSEQCAAAVKATPDLSQVAIHLQNVLGATLRQSQGYDPEILMGHSFGEIAALGVGGCFDLPTGVQVVCERVRAVREHAPPGGGLLVVSSDRQCVSTEASLLGFDQIVIAGRNHDQQTVASGPHDQLEEFREYLRQVDINAVSVPSPTSFHHPRLRDAAAVWLERLRKLALRGPSRAVYSPIGRRFIRSDDDVAATLTSQFLRPFDLQGAISDVMAAGVTKFVDCGSSGSLARIISKAGPEELSVNGTEVSGLLAGETGRKADASTNAKQEKTSRPRIAVEKQRKVKRNRRHVSPVAIVGQGCLLPGGACSPEKLHEAITEQRSGVVDQRRYDPNWSEDFYSEQLVPDRSTSHLMGRVNDDDILVPSGVDSKVFERFTRAQRLLCVALAPCVDALRDADRVLCLIGATADGFEDQDVVSSLRYAGIDPTNEEVDRRIDTAKSAYQSPHSAIQEVIDQVVRPGLEVTLIDAACASSLYTVALGIQALEANRTDAVIAGGVFCPGQGNSCLFSQFYGTTSTGCRPFDVDADGVVFSEGAALVTLRRVVDAKRLELPIAAVLQGFGLSSDGRSTSANVPQTHGQILSLQRCYANYDIDPSTIQAIETHGTSTPVGDTTELETLRSFFSGVTQHPIPLHSLKGVLGHAGWAAGTASLIAACQYLKTGTFPAQAHFHQPSQALIESADTLTVLEQKIPLPNRQMRVAVDGFGFGGANAHFVLDNFVPEEKKRNGTKSDSKRSHSESQDDLVILAYHELVPTQQTPNGLQFDRRSETLLGRHVLLPDLADDLDICQTLTIRLVDEIILQLAEFEDEYRPQTSVLLAKSGKTERGVEATMRVLAQRLRRHLAGCDSFLKALDFAADRARPSGPYTLQCMMPNVSAGRAALQLDLNGPNFVVDADTKSLEAAFTSASSLLQGGDDGGTRIVVVAAIEANPYRAQGPDPAAIQNEFAAAFAITTRRYAEELGLTVLSSVQPHLEEACDELESHSTGEKVRALIDRLKNPSASSSSTPSLNDESIDLNCPIHSPVWVEKPLRNEPVKSAGERKSILAIAPANSDLVDELMVILPTCSQRFMVAVVGAGASQVAAEINKPNVLCVNADEEEPTSAALDRLDDFSADLVISVDAPLSWELSKTLGKVSSDNSLCELMFLIAQRHAARLRQGSVELWSLFLEGWNGVVHPATGAMAGFLKAVSREFSHARIGVIATRGGSLNDGLQRVLVESRLCNVEQEIVYDHSVRMVRRFREVVQATDQCTELSLDSESVVVATGGAHGVTAVLMDSLLRDYQCTVIAIGRSSLEAGPVDPNGAQAERNFYERFVRDHPDASAYEMKKSFELTRARWEAHQTMQQLSLLGGKAEYIVADVTDNKQVEKTLRQIASEHGRIDLLVHGAGVQLSKRLEDRSLEDFRETYSVKVTGLRNLVDNYHKQFGETLNTHVLTSAYSIFGNDGQHDYGAANETLDRLCAMSQVHEDQSWSSIAWLAWDGIGMTRGSEYRALADQRGLSGLNIEDGQRVFREVLAGRTQSAVNVPISDAEHVKYGVKVVPRATERSIGRVVELSLELSKVACLPFHEVRNTPTLPGAWILDRMVAAGLHLVDGKDVASVTISDVSFSRFVRLANGHEPNIRVIAEETSSQISVWMVGDVLHPTGFTLSQDLVFAEAKLHFDGKAVELVPALRCIRTGNGSGLNRLVSDPYCNGRCGDVELSGPFDCVRDIEIGSIGRRARFSPDPSCDLPGVIPAMLLDSAWRVGAMHAISGEDALYVPIQIGRLVMPLGMTANASSASGWEIRTSAPIIQNRDICMERTEVLDEIGAVKMLVENTFATRMQ